MAKKIDWIKLKQEFLAGDIEDVSEFCKKQGLSKPEASGSVGKATKGWKEERNSLKQTALEAAKSKHIEQSILPNEKLLKMKENILIIVGNKIAKEQDKMSAADLKSLIQIIKTELGEPITINVNRNLDQSLDKNGNPTDPNSFTFIDITNLTPEERKRIIAQNKNAGSNN